MFAPRPDTFLCVDGPGPLGHVAVGVHGAHEDRLVLTHTGVGEQQGGVVQRDGGRRVDVSVGLLHVGGKSVSYQPFLDFSLIELTQTNPVKGYGDRTILI